MSRHGFAVAYDGTARASSHTIDVENLAPALLAFGRLIREANTEFNGKRATAKVLVVSDFEAKCFNINFDVVLSFYQQLKTLIGSDDVVAAKDILEWLGIVGGAVTGSVGASYTFLEFLKWKRGRKVTTGKELVAADRDKSGTVEVFVEGDGNSVHVHNHVYNLSQNPRALRATRDAFLPLGQDGFESVEFKEADLIFRELDAEDVEQIVASCNVGIEEAKETEPEVEVTPAWLSVYSPVFDAAAPNWRFRLGKDVIYADITETQIAADAMARGGSLMDDAYQVRLQITTPVDPKGKKKESEYKILQVIRFVAGTPSEQKSLFP